MQNQAQLAFFLLEKLFSSCFSQTTWDLTLEVTRMQEGLFQLVRKREFF